MNDYKTAISLTSGISSKAQSIQEVVEGTISIAVSQDIEVLGLNSSEKRPEQRRVWKVVLSAGLSGTGATIIVGVVIEVIILLGLGHPKRTCQQRCVSLNRPIEDELSTSMLDSVGGIVADDVEEGGQVWRSDPIVRVNIYGQSISQSFVDGGLGQREGDVLGGGDSHFEIGLSCALDLLRSQLRDAFAVFDGEWQDGIFFEDSREGSIREAIEDSAWGWVTLICDTQQLDSERVSNNNVGGEVLKHNRMFSRYPIELKSGGVPVLCDLIVAIALAVHLLARLYVVVEDIVLGVLEHLRDGGHGAKGRRRNGKAQVLSNGGHAEVRVAINKAGDQGFSFQIDNFSIFANTAEKIFLLWANNFEDLAVFDRDTFGQASRIVHGDDFAIDEQNISLLAIILGLSLLALGDDCG